MEIKNYEYVLIPNILKDFKCVSCGDCCTKKWRIDIDKKSFQTTAEGLKKLNEDPNEYFSKVKDSDNYVVKFGEKYCKFIEDDGLLCKIHKDFGWECLSDTCKIYPREFKMTSRGAEMGLVFSCHVAARLLLSDKKVEILKLPKEEFFFMKPHEANFIIPENNFETHINSRYYEYEAMAMEIFSMEGNVGKKYRYVIDTLADLENVDARQINFNDYIEKFKTYEAPKDSGEQLKDSFDILMDIKEGRGKRASIELRELLRASYLTDDLAANKAILQVARVGLTKEYFDKLNEMWTPRYEKILNNYASCLIFGKSLYNTKKYGVVKMVTLSFLLKLRILLQAKFVKRELTDDELVFIIKSQDDSFAHDGEYFKLLYDFKSDQIKLYDILINMLTVL